MGHLRVHLPPEKGGSAPTAHGGRGLGPRVRETHGPGQQHTGSLFPGGFGSVTATVPRQPPCKLELVLGTLHAQPGEPHAEKTSAVGEPIRGAWIEGANGRFGGSRAPWWTAAARSLSPGHACDNRGRVVLCHHPPPWAACTRPVLTARPQTSDRQRPPTLWALVTHLGKVHQGVGLVAQLPLLHLDAPQSVGRVVTATLFDAC